MSSQMTSPTRERRARLFRNGRNQALRIPREMELPGRVARLRKEGSRLIVEPAERPSLLDVLATLDPIDESALAIPRVRAESVDV
jgi:antitoxin VapB